VGSSLSLLSWFTHRKDRLKKEEEQRKSGVTPPKEES